VGVNRLHGQEWGPKRYAASRGQRLASLRLAAALPHSCLVQTGPQEFGEVLRSLVGNGDRNKPGNKDNEATTSAFVSNSQAKPNRINR